jgi:pimeloyl-ACP methyl ester carboxylesterase
MRISGKPALAMEGILLLILFGCAAQPINPSFPVTADFARRDLRRMESNPRRLDRPLLIITGFMDPGFAALAMRARFEAATGDDRVIIVALEDCGTYAQCTQKLIRAVDEAFPSASPTQTSEVDVIGYSMGGLVARLAANPPDNARRLRIHRLFTISTPNQGAIRAKELPLLHPLQGGMRPGSPLLAQLNSRPEPYRVISYIRLGDKVIGPPNAVIPGGQLWWVSTLPFTNPHLGAPGDPRILDDIARRLRGEPPLTTVPPAPLPPANKVNST